MADQGLRGFGQQGLGIGQHPGNAPRLVQPGADGGHVTRAIAVECKTGKGAVDVGDTAQGFTELVAEGGGFEKVIQRSLAGVDHMEVERGRGETAFEKPGAAGGDGTVDGGEERAVAAAGQGLGQFQVAAGCGVDLHRAAEGFADGRAEKRHPAALGEVEVVDEGAHRGDLGPVEAAEGVEGGDGEEVAEALLGIG